MNISILLVLDKIDNTLYPIDVSKDDSNCLDIYKKVLSTTTLTQKDIPLDEFIEFLVKENKISRKSDGYNIKDYTLFYI